MESAPAGEVEAPARATNEVAAPALPANAEFSPSPAVAPAISPPPALAAPVESVSPLPARASNRAEEPDGADALLPQFDAAAAGGDPLDHLTAMLDSVAPEPPLSREIMPLAVPAIPLALRALIAGLGPAGAKARTPLTPLQRNQTAPEPPLLRLTTPMALNPTPRQTLERPFGAKLLAMPAAPLAVLRPNTPPLELAPAIAPLGKYSPLEGRPLRPAVPQVQVLKKETGPRTTLPGPMLTRRLVKFMDRELKPIMPGMLRVKKSLIPGWMASALIIGTLLGAGFTSVISIVRPAAEDKHAAAAEMETPAPPATTSASASPLAKAIEVTGFRIQMDPGKKSEIQYLVVNHTPARFDGVTVYVTLYAADGKAGQPPLCKFQFTAPNLAPYQSKDMASAIEQVARPVTLPDWQDLRASVEIGQ